VCSWVWRSVAGDRDPTKQSHDANIREAHTIVAAPGYRVKEGKAAMGNYNHFLTIQELVNLVAFLKEGTKADGK
jgi:hypothetical protein